MADTGIDAFTAHGGRVDAARAAYGAGDWIDLSTGVAPWAYPVPAAAPTGLAMLPDPAAIAALEAAAGAAFGVIAGLEIVAVPGTDLALRLLAPLLPGPAAVVRPGYAGHAAAWRDAVSITRLEDVGEARCVVLASPNNPDGRLFDHAAIHALAGAGVTVVVDEAYADDLPNSLCVERNDGVIVLRSFGKYYGLPGLRLGFVIATAPIAGRLRAMLGDWPVSTLAATIGTAAYRDTGWRRDQSARIATAGERLDAALAGVPIVGRAGLFRLVEAGEAHRLFDHLARHRILTRPFADRPDRLRLGLPRDAAAADRLAVALKEFV